MISHPQISIIVISYNTKEITLECLRSVREQTSIPYELIVVDNASTDGSVEAIRREFPDIIFFSETKNHGFAGANNLAGQHATAEYLLLLNPDTIVLEQAIDKLLNFSKKIPEAKIWGGRTLFEDHSLNPASCWRRMTLWSLACRAAGLTGIFPRSAFFNSEAYGGWHRDTVRQVDIVTGCFFLIKRLDWIELDGFDETFFMYGEEADLCMRAQSCINAIPHVTPEAVIIHLGGASERVREDKMVRLLTAKMELIERHFNPWQKMLAKKLFAGWPLSRALVYNMLRPNSEQASSWKKIWLRRAEWLDGFSK